MHNVPPALEPTGVPAVALALEHVLGEASAQEMLFTTFSLDRQPQFLLSKVDTIEIPRMLLALSTRLTASSCCH